MQTTGNQVSLYFHIPFCTKKCGYCHFYVLPDHENLKNQLLEGFKLEWERMLPLLQNKAVSTIYFGGGTPSLFGPERIAFLINMIKKDVPFVSPQIEITLEVNPENSTPSLMQAYAEAGINRVSIGIQTLDNGLLHILGRVHHAHTAINAVNGTHAAGITNISVDLMYDLPHQTLAQWQNTLKMVGDLPITHLSLYNLTIEPHTLFFKKQEALRKWLPDEETSLHMYESAISHLEEKGLMQYEISAFAKAGYEAKHNSGYWTGRPFLGFGPSAFSYWDGKRFRNIANLNRYCAALEAGASPIDFEEELKGIDHVRELFVIQIRLKRGVHLARFQEEHGVLDPSTMETLERLKTEGWIEQQNDVICLTQKGILFYDHVASELI